MDKEAINKLSNQFDEEQQAIVDAMHDWLDTDIADQLVLMAVIARILYIKLKGKGEGE